MDTPLQIKIEEAKQEIVNSINKIINEKELDYYFLHLIIKEIFNEITVNKDLEIAQLQKQQEIKDEDNLEIKKEDKRR